MTAAGFIAVWEFIVEPASRAEFIGHYGPDGSWARLFRRAPGYLGTELLNDRANPLRYVTVDRWASIEDWRAFRERFGQDYAALDRRCERLTVREAALGEFETALAP